MTSRSMSTKYFLSSIIRDAPLKFSDGIPCVTSKYHCASVACILRILPRMPNTDIIIRSPSDALNYLDNSDVEMLFIRRTHRGGDRWSGDTAFPGGFIDIDESDMCGVKREVREELGLDLSDTSQFAWLGRLRNTNFGDNHKVITPHVFLYMKSSGPLLALQPSEVAAAAWVNVEELLRRNTNTLDVRSASLPELFFRFGEKQKIRKFIAYKLAWLFNCSTIYFPCINLPIYGPIFPGNETKDAGSYTSAKTPEEVWVLWGMTFRFVRDVLTAGNDNVPYIDPALPFWVDNKLFNVFLKFWHRRITYSGSHIASGTELLGLSLICLVGTGLATALSAAYMYKHGFKPP
mmetsp:Transcript_19925/g.28643  ORF Transcript_19925/g.28643 Transcript_19925/m.28643 type:complete len:348 (-) Transcript_19925:22-1065(-)